MKLIDWMKQRDLDDDGVAGLIGGVSGSAVKKWKYGERVPRKEQMRRVNEITNGAVTANDFMAEETSP